MTNTYGDNSTCDKCGAPVEDTLHPCPFDEEKDEPETDCNCCTVCMEACLWDT